MESDAMTYDEAIALLRQARSVLERHMFEEDGHCWDDIAEICMKIDDQLPPPTVQAIAGSAGTADRAA
jgi:uncharacterized protein (DUF779 family)